MITVLNAILAAFAEVYVLILGVYYKLQTFIYFTISGIVQGIRPLMSYNLGAGRKDRVMGIFKVTLLLSLGVMVIGTILCLAIPGQLMDIFTDTPQTVQQGAIALRIISAGFIVSAISVVVSGSFEALGKGMPSLKRHAVFDNIAASVYRHSSHSASYVLPVSGSGRMAFVLDNGTAFRRRFVHTFLEIVLQRLHKAEL